MPSGSAVDVFDYLDFRAFLKDYYLQQKASHPSFSYRVFSKRAGLRSPNYLKLVVDAQRNLTPKVAIRFAEACRLDVEASHYFVTLVAFGQAKTAKEKSALYATLTASVEYRKTHTLEAEQLAYHSKWYYPVVRELVTRIDFREDPVWVASVLVPAITADEARQALDALLALGLLERKKSGALTQATLLVSTGPERRAVQVANYHRTMMTQAMESIDRIPSGERDISTLTLCLSPSGVRRLKERIQRFRRELLELSAGEVDPRQVVQVNFQLFPVSKP